MQSGSLTRVIRQEGPGVWQFRWSEKSQDGKRIYRKRIIGSADQYKSKEAARMAVTGLLSEINLGKGIVKPTTLTWDNFAIISRSEKWHKKLHGER